MESLSLPINPYVPCVYMCTDNSIHTFGHCWDIFCINKIKSERIIFFGYVKLKSFCVRVSVYCADGHILLVLVMSHIYHSCCDHIHHIIPLTQYTIYTCMQLQWGHVMHGTMEVTTNFFTINFISQLHSGLTEFGLEVALFRCACYPHTAAIRTEHISID